MNQGNDSVLGFETLAVHAGEQPDPLTGAVAPGLVRTKTYAQKFGEVQTYEYSRGKNPTRSSLEEKLAALEGEGAATVFSSGVAAEAMLLFTLSPGDHVLLCHEVYGGTFRLFDQLFNRFGILYDFVNFGDTAEVKRYIKPTTRYFFVETPTNPSLHVIDLKKVGELSRQTGIPFVTDMTFSPPCTTRAFEYGAETVIHSLSKYCAGHNDVIAGAVITKNKELHEKLKFMQRTVGAILSPDECYRVLQGIKTLSLRWQRVSESAQKVAEFLSSYPKISRVLYPGLPTHPGYDIAQLQMKNGCGGTLSFELRETNKEKIKKFVDTVTKNHLVVYGESLASPETILAYPPHMSHKSLPTDVRLSLGISDGFFRLSLGFEDPRDIIAALEQALTVI